LIKSVSIAIREVLRIQLSLFVFLLELEIPLTLEEVREYAAANHHELVEYVWK
jgi:hypothetical protein